VFAITHAGSSKKKLWKPHFYEAKPKDEGGPMEIDRLEPQEEKRRKENNLCFKCGKPGHCIAQCRSEGSTSQPGNGKGKTPQSSEKKINFQGN